MFETGAQIEHRRFHAFRNFCTDLERLKVSGQKHKPTYSVAVGNKIGSHLGSLEVVDERRGTEDLDGCWDAFLPKLACHVRLCVGDESERIPGLQLMYKFYSSAMSKHQSAPVKTAR